MFQNWTMESVKWHLDDMKYHFQKNAKRKYSILKGVLKRDIVGVEKRTYQEKKQRIVTRDASMNPIPMMDEVESMAREILFRDIGDNIIWGNCKVTRTEYE